MSYYKNCIKCDTPKQDERECPNCGVIYSKAEAEFDKKLEISLAGIAYQDITPQNSTPESPQEVVKRRSSSFIRVVTTIFVVSGCLSAGLRYFPDQMYRLERLLFSDDRKTYRIELENSSSFTHSLENPQDQIIIQALLGNITDHSPKAHEYLRNAEELQKAIEALREMKQHPEHLTALTQLELGKTHQAKKLFIKIIQQGVKGGNSKKTEAAKAANHLAALIRLVDIDDAIEKYKHATELDPENTNSWFQLAHLYQQKGNFNLADSAFQSLLSIGEGSEVLNDVAVSYKEMAETYWKRGELYQAAEMHDRALTIYQTLDNKSEVVNQYNTIGFIYKRYGDYNQASDMHSKALLIGQDTNDQYGIARAYLGLGLAYYHQNKNETSLEMLQKSLTAYQSLNSRSGIAHSYHNLGLVYLAIGELDRATEMLNKSFEIYSSLNDTYSLAHYYNSMAGIHKRRKEVEKAFYMYNKSLELYQDLNDNFGMALCYRNLSYMYKSSSDLENAIEMMTSAVTLFKKSGAKARLEKAEKALIRLQS